MQWGNGAYGRKGARYTVGLLEVHEEIQQAMYQRPVRSVVCALQRKPAAKRQLKDKRGSNTCTGGV